MTQQPSKKPWEIQLVADYSFDEVASALQKTIRRGLEYEACWWAFIMHESSYYKYVWKRLAVIASEDIGNATPEAAMLVHSLQQNYHYTITAANRNKNDALVFIFQAVMFMCRAVKSREADSLVNLIRVQYERGTRHDIPEFAIDFHTRRGRAQHGNWNDGSQEDIDRRQRMWFDKFSLVEPDIGDRYVAELRKLKGVES